jgi:hypothetical protein
MPEPETTDPLAKAARGRNWDALAALIAALIGVFALLVSGYTAYVQRQQVRAQVWPHLLVGNYDPEHAIGVLNKGVGPAIVRSVQVFVDGKPQRTWKQVFEALGLPLQGFMVSTISSNVISAGERVVALTVGDEAAYRNFRKELGQRFGIEICYCSTLGECWIYSDRTQGVRASDSSVDRCPRPPDTETFND